MCALKKSKSEYELLVSKSSEDIVLCVERMQHTVGGSSTGPATLDGAVSEEAGSGTGLRLRFHCLLMAPTHITNHLKHSFGNFPSCDATDKFIKRSELSTAAVNEI